MAHSRLQERKIRSRLENVVVSLDNSVAIGLISVSGLPMLSSEVPDFDYSFAEFQPYPCGAVQRYHTAVLHASLLDNNEF